MGRASLALPVPFPSFDRASFPPADGLVPMSCVNIILERGQWRVKIGMDLVEVERALEPPRKATKWSPATPRWRASP